MSKSDEEFMQRLFNLALRWQYERTLREFDEREKQVEKSDKASLYHLVKCKGKE
jgi:hypothetical protein